MKPVTFIEPGDLIGVFEALSSDRPSRLIAGGSDLLGQLKDGSEEYERLVSLAGVGVLRGLTAGPAGLTIGALTTIYELETATELSGAYRMLAEAARSVATPEIRNQGTLGGNLCQRPRCLHYRHALVHCLKKGGEGCPAVLTPHQAYLSVFGGSGCAAVNPADLAPPLIALDAIAVIEGASGVRELPIESFFTGPEIDPTRENTLEASEVLTAVRLPAMLANWRGLYSKSRDRTAGDFAIVSAAIGYALEQGRMTRVRVVLGGVAPTPLRIRAAEAILEGSEPSEDTAARAAETALAGATPLDHNEYKLDLVRALITRNVMRVAAG